jgi:hypothetical protein
MAQIDAIESVRHDLAAWSASKPPRVRSIAGTLDSILKDYADGRRDPDLIFSAKFNVTSLEREIGR